MLTVKKDGILLLFTSGVHCSAKYELKRSQFYLVSAKNFSLRSIWGMKGIVLPFKTIFKSSEYFLELRFLFDNLWDKVFKVLPFALFNGCIK